MKVKFRFKKGILEVAISGAALTQEPRWFQVEGDKGASALVGEAE